MNKVLIVLAFLCMFFLVQESDAQTRNPEAMPGISPAYYGMYSSSNPYATVDMLNHIRRERFELILPRVMRENEIDMWIHVIRPWTWSGNEHRQLEHLNLNYSSIDSTDPMRYEFGSNAAVLVFTDRGGDRIERVVFEGEVEDGGAYDIVRGQSKFINQENYEIMDYMNENPDKVPESEMDYRFLGLGEFVAERNPKTIGVNYAEKLSLAEGSETYTLALTDGISYADHLHLSKALGNKYAKRMVSAEDMILDYLSRRVIGEIVLFGIADIGRSERGFRDIELGVTTLGELRGGYVRHADGSETDDRDYVIRGGDLVGMGVNYVLRKGETGPSPEVEKLWEETLRVREILRENLRVGPTAGEMCDLLIRKLEEAGFAYIDRDQYDINLDPEKTQVHLDMHAMGKGVLAPRISPMGPRWHWDIKIPLLHTFAVEYMVHMPVPEWGPGQHLYTCIHDDGVITERGMEYPNPPFNDIQIIK